MLALAAIPSRDFPCPFSCLSAPSRFRCGRSGAAEGHQPLYACTARGREQMEALPYLSESSGRLPLTRPPRPKGSAMICFTESGAFAIAALVAKVPPLGPVSGTAEEGVWCGVTWGQVRGHAFGPAAPTTFYLPRSEMKCKSTAIHCNGTGRQTGEEAQEVP